MPRNTKQVDPAGLGDDARIGEVRLGHARPIATPSHQGNQTYSFSRVATARFPHFCPQITKFLDLNGLTPTLSNACRYLFMPNGSSALPLTGYAPIYSCGNVLCRTSYSSCSKNPLRPSRLGLHVQSAQFSRHQGSDPAVRSRNHYRLPGSAPRAGDPPSRHRRISGVQEPRAWQGRPHIYRRRRRDHGAASNRYITRSMQPKSASELMTSGKRRFQIPLLEGLDSQVRRSGHRNVVVQ